MTNYELDDIEAGLRRRHVSLAMTPAEREAFLADLHVGVVSVTAEGRAPLTMPIWYSYEPGGTVSFITGRASRKAALIEREQRLSLCAQTEEARTGTSPSRARSSPSRTTSIPRSARRSSTGISGRSSETPISPRPRRMSPAAS